MRGQTTTGIVTAIVILIIIIGGVWWYVAANPAPATQTTRSSDAQAVDAVATGFGQELQMVSLLASSTDASAAIAQYYAPYVDPTLLSQWESNPAAAPGRLTSSPWPDHIDITSTTQNADGSYSISGDVAEVTSTGPAGTYPITATVAQENGAWLITSFSGYPPVQAQ